MAKDGQFHGPNAKYWEPLSAQIKRQFPTCNAGDVKQTGNVANWERRQAEHAAGGTNLQRPLLVAIRQAQAKFPTATESDRRGAEPSGQRVARSAGGLNLNGAVKFPTASARDVKGTNSKPLKERNAESGGEQLPNFLKHALDHDGELNPDWEEPFMGWPLGWTDPDTPCAGEWPGWPLGPGPYQYAWEPPRTVPRPPRGTYDSSKRVARVEMCGNGAVPQSAAVAYAAILDSLGVPRVPIPQEEQQGSHNP